MLKFLFTPKALTAILILILVISAVSYYFYMRHQNTKGSDEVKNLVEQVGKIMELPANEEPTIATVTDVNKLKNQPFFARAIVGDKVLIYVQARKAILYRPATNKIIEVAPISSSSIENSQKTPPTSGLTPTITQTLNSKKVTIGIFNGTKTVGLASSTEKELTEKMANIQVIIKGDAKNNYNSTIVVDQKGTNKDIATQIANLLNGQVGALPVKEVSSSADIIIILGTTESSSGSKN